MKTFKFLTLAFLISLSASLPFGKLGAQSDLTLYNFSGVPQSLHANPALPQRAKFYIGLPAISGVHAHYHNNGFALVDLLKENTDVNENLDRILLNTDERTHIAYRQNVDLLNVGFRAGKTFWHFGAQQTTDLKMGYPVDLLRFLRGTAVGNSSNIGGFNYEVLNRTNYFLGFQQKLLKDSLTIGGRAKFIMGQQHAHSERTEAHLTTDDSSAISVETDLLLRSAGISQFLGDGGYGVDNVLGEVFTKNAGFAVDLGAHWRISPKWSASVSALDLGFINWTENTRAYQTQGRFTFDGIDADVNGGDLDNFTDSLQKAFQIVETDGESYRRWLSSRVFAGANFHITPKNAVGALYHARFWKGEMYHDFSVNYQGFWSRGFQFTTSYSLINGTKHNVGAGLSLKLFPLQLYIVSDNILHAIYYEKLQTSNVRVGLNLTFYGKSEKARVRKEEKKAIKLRQKMERKEEKNS